MSKTKGKKEKTGQEEKIDFFAQTLELSKRETKYLIDNKYIDLKL